MPLVFRYIHFLIDLVQQLKTFFYAPAVMLLKKCNINRLLTSAVNWAWTRRSLWYNGSPCSIYH